MRNLQEMQSMTVAQIAIDRMIGSTANIIDRHKCLAALAYADKRGLRKDFVELYLEARLDWLNWLTKTQRKWQGETRNKNKARHNDSIAIREKYVRCNA